MFYLGKERRLVISNIFLLFRSKVHVNTRSHAFNIMVKENKNNPLKNPAGLKLWKTVSVGQGGVLVWLISASQVVTLGQYLSSPWTISSTAYFVSHVSIHEHSLCTTLRYSSLTDASPFSLAAVQVCIRNGQSINDWYLFSWDSCFPLCDTSMDVML